MIVLILLLAQKTQQIIGGNALKSRNAVVRPMTQHTSGIGFGVRERESRVVTWGARVAMSDLDIWDMFLLLSALS